MELISVKKQWDELMEKAALPDFYFSYDYHQISRGEEEEAVLLHLGKKDSGILMPLLFRPIPGSEFRDATSVYGYAGPLWYGELSEPLILEFHKSLKTMCEENKLISIFSRLHPYIPEQHQVLKGLGIIDNPGMVVNIDLTIPLKDQWSEVSRRSRTYINKARRTYRVYEAKSDADLDEFVSLYIATMERVQAEDMYFFDYEYYRKLWTNSHFDTKILLAACPEQGRFISGAMFISCGNIIQYHLSGTDAKYLKLHPLKLLIDEMRVLGTEMGMKYFNLGGGLGGSQDSLFNFKSRFSNDYRQFHVWKFIADQKIYDQITKANEGENRLKDPEKSKDYFPGYRN